ncbi:DEAD/DEAH box helicase [Lactobacillus sp. Marseille-P7033]|nr:DEAD/DEAH box helicase [Lactobacillus sp. Marseille-P7033]NGC77404.1 DEAD/DEAH box helicase [Limosilactobacillus reuteri]
MKTTNKMVMKEFFGDITSNKYLKVLFSKLLNEYSNKLFGEKYRIEPSAKRDLMRFADLLAHSRMLKESNYHQSLSQQIIFMLGYLFPSDISVKFVKQRIMSSLNNYSVQDKNLQTAPSGDAFLNYLVNSYKKSELKIPGSDDQIFIGEQKAIYNEMSKNTLSFSAPTSMGKSFLARTYIKNQVLANANSNYAFVVPTKALINEISSKIINDLGNGLSQQRYKVIRSVNELSEYSQDNACHYIFVMTPERLMYLLIAFPDIDLPFVFIDEAQNISKHDERAGFYYNLIDMLEEKNARISFASPNIPNPDIYLELIRSSESNKCARNIKFSPVVQIPYVINFTDNTVKIYNSVNRQLKVLDNINAISLFDIISSFSAHSDDKTQNLIYCNKIDTAIGLAVKYADNKLQDKNDVELNQLASDIKNEINEDYYLADLVKKGVAYHVSFLPKSVRIRIEKAYRSGKIKNLFSTSTLMEGVNLPADNLIVTSNRKGTANLSPVDFRNLIGRTGRLRHSMIGNVFLATMPESFSGGSSERDYIKLLESNADKQRLNTDVLTKKVVLLVKESLLDGDLTMKVLFNLSNWTNWKYKTVRKFALQYLNDIQNNRQSIVRSKFQQFISRQEEQEIVAKLCKKYNDNFDNDVNISADQTSNLKLMIKQGLNYPQFDDNGQLNYQEVISFLDQMDSIFNWQQYEKNKIGNANRRRWYAVVLIQWISGLGLRNIINKAIEYKRDNPHNAIYHNQEYYDFDDSKSQKNIVINDTLYTIQNVVLFDFANYFLRVSKEMKRYLNVNTLDNDWYEFIEYGTHDRFRIWLQKCGYSRESAYYIEKHPEYFDRNDTSYRLKRTLLEIEDTNLRDETRDIMYNHPEIFK